MDERHKMPYFINAGMYVINPEYLSEIPEKTFYYMT